MELDEIINAAEGNLIRVIMENASSHNKEEIIGLLEKVGLDTIHATELTEVLYMGSQNYENQSEKTPDKTITKCALLMVAQRMQVEQIGDDILKKLYENKIPEDEINNLALKKVFHYYSEARTKREADLVKVKGYSRRFSEEIARLRKQLENAENQINDLKGALYNKGKSDENYYQKALAEIRKLRNTVKRMQTQSVFQFMGSKLKRIGERNENQLPESTTELPETLEESTLNVKVDNDLVMTPVKTISNNRKNSKSTEQIK